MSKRTQGSGYDVAKMFKNAPMSDDNTKTMGAVTALQARAEQLLEQTVTQETAEQLAMIAQAFAALSCAVQVSLDPDEWADAGLRCEELAEQCMRPVVAWQGGQ